MRFLRRALQAESCSSRALLDVFLVGSWAAFHQRCQRLHPQGVGLSLMSSTGHAVPLPHDDLSPVIVERLHAEGIQTCQQWRALGARRDAIWGVTRRARKQVDAAVTAALARMRE